MKVRRLLSCPPGHLDLPGAPLTLQVMFADHTDGLPAAVDGFRDVLDDGPTCGVNDWSMNAILLT